MDIEHLGLILDSEFFLSPSEQNGISCFDIILYHYFSILKMRNYLFEITQTFGKSSPRNEVCFLKKQCI